jgi:2-oxoisovalerate ferredoxin oxidoreductase alpha subunit
MSSARSRSRNIGPEQGDYNHVVKARSRNYVFVPRRLVQEICDFTIKAFELSYKYRNPAVVLADGVLGQMIEPLSFPMEAVAHKPDESWAVRGNKSTSGILVTSILLDFDEMEALNNKLQDKYALIEKTEQDARIYHDDANIILCRTEYQAVRRRLRLICARGNQRGLVVSKRFPVFRKTYCPESPPARVRFSAVEM